jgi:O-succinylbenzoate synthase
MKIEFAPYILTPFEGGTPRKGALLKIFFPDVGDGYADVHPWPEWGDQPIEQQLIMLRKGEYTSVTEQSMWFAARDAQARLEKRSLLNPAIQLKNNFLVTNFSKLTTEELDHIKKTGFTTIKLKVGNDFDLEVALVKKITQTQNMMLRLDYNLKGSFESLEKLIKQLSPTQAKLIQYVEDPFPYDLKKWQEARKLTKLAIDFEIEKLELLADKKPECDVVIVKPARRNVGQFLEVLSAWNLNFTVTSSMDHPVGVVHALSVAQDLRQSLPKLMLDPGCMTFKTYKMEPYAASLPTKGPFLGSADGYGVGFNHLLQKEAWKQLA